MLNPLDGAVLVRVSNTTTAGYADSEAINRKNRTCAVVLDDVG